MKQVGLAIALIVATAATAVIAIRATPAQAAGQEQRAWVKAVPDATIWKG